MLKNLKHKQNSQKGFTMVEAVVAALIFAAVVVGIFSTTAALKKPAIGSDKKLTAAYYGKQILEDLRSKVDQRDWDLAAGSLSLGPHPPVTMFNPTYGVTYTVTYTVTAVPGSTARQVALTVQWPD